MNGWLGVLVGVVLLVASAFFVGAEFALIAARRSQIETLAEQGSRRARVTLRAMENVTLMMAGAQLGITVCTVLLGAVTEPAVHHMLDPVFTALGVPPAAATTLAFVVALLIVAYLHVVLGEMVPKNIALAGPERAALALGPPLAAFVRALRPVLIFLNGVANAVLRVFGMQPREEVSAAFSREEIADMVAESRREGLLRANNYELLSGALTLSQHTAASVLLRSDELVVLDAASTPRDVELTSARTGFSRFPLSDHSGQLVGYVHLKDALGMDSVDRDRPLSSRRIRPLPEVGEADSLDVVLNTMRTAGAHLGRVRGGDGTSTLGVVALEDVIERLVGDIRDATQRTQPPTVTDPRHMRRGQA